MKSIVFITLLFALTSCISQESSIPKRYIDDIEFDESIDSKSFKPCNEKYTIQYFNNSNGLEYEGGKIQIEKAFQDKYNFNIVKKESGLIRIRFIVNCKGETGWFRILGMDEQYKEKEFDSSITSQILKITKELNGWQIKEYKGRHPDYYQYLIFKIEKGQIIKILP